MRYRGVMSFLKGLERGLRDLKPALDNAGLKIVSITKKRIKEGISPPNAPLTVKAKGGDKTLMDTGRLLASITYSVRGKELSYGTDVFYAPIHQFGARISPKKAKKLAIPATPEMKSSARRKGVRATLDKLRASGWKIWFTDGAIMGRKGKGGSKVLFVRKDSVEIPKREFLRFGEEEERVLEDAILKHLFGGE